MKKPASQKHLNQKMKAALEALFISKEEFQKKNHEYCEAYRKWKLKEHIKAQDKWWKEYFKKDMKTKNNKPTKKQKIERPKLQRPCDYNYPGCLKVTDLQYIKKLGSVTLYKSWICDNCLSILEPKQKK